MSYSIQPALDAVVTLAKYVDGLEHVYQAIPSAKTEREKKVMFRGPDGNLQCVQVWNYQGMLDTSEGNFIQWHDMIFLDCWLIFGGPDHVRILQGWLDRIVGLVAQSETLGGSVHQLLSVVKKRQPSEDMFGEHYCHFGRIEITVGQIFDSSVIEDVPWQD